MSATVDSIERLGHPLGFKFKNGSARPGVLGTAPSRDVITVESRQLEGHQKEGVVTEGAHGSTWRLTTDEDGHLRGTDLAPFPLGYFNAGLHADLTNRIVTLGTKRGIDLNGMTMALDNGYSMTGSFFKGTGEGFAEPATIEVSFANSSSTETLHNLVSDAVIASPAFALMRMPLQNTFAIYVNGRRRKVSTMLESQANDAADPFVTYSSAPEPLASAETFPDLVHKTGQKSEGVSVVAPGDMTTRQIRPVIGRSELIHPEGGTETDVVLGIPGASNFKMKSDERMGADMAPSGLSLLSAGVAFCYMTQMSRYIEYQKMAIRGVRLVQNIPFTLSTTDDGELIGGAEPADTHLFLSGDEDNETFERLMKIAERTCYLHKTMSDVLEPNITVHNND